MRKVILALAVSLDGYIKGPNGEYDWCFTDQDYGMTAFLARIDALFIGRKSYELLINPAEPASGYQFAAYKRYVFSNTLREVEAGFTLLSGDVQTRVAELRNQPGMDLPGMDLPGKDLPGKDFWLFGGADLTRSFFNAGLVDELFLAVHPILLGSGKPLTGRPHDRINLTLTGTKTYDTGLASLWYRVS